MIVGQEGAVHSVQSMIERDKIPGALLFYGPPGVGKFSLSIEFSYLIEEDDRVYSLTHPDLHVIYPDYGYDREEIISLRREGKYYKLRRKNASIKIDSIRDIIDKAYLSPYSGRYKIFILLEAHRMTEEAQNAFLKVLEEPSQTTIFILITPKPDNLLPTILSRLYPIRFTPLGEDELREILGERYKGEDVYGVEEFNMLYEEEYREMADFILEHFFERDPVERIYETKEIRDVEIELLIQVLRWIISDIISIKTGGRLIFPHLKDRIVNISQRFTIDELREKVEKTNKAYIYSRHYVKPALLYAYLMLEV